MNTFLDLIGSYMVGGFILITMLGLFFYFSSRSQVSKLNEVTEISISETGKVIEYDFNALGYRVESGNKVVSLSTNAITFRGDVDNNSVIDTVSYSVLSVNGAKSLRRTVSNAQVKSWTIPVKNASLVFRDSVNNVTDSPSLVRCVEVNIQLEPASPAKDAAPGLYWTRKFFPKNL